MKIESGTKITRANVESLRYRDVLIYVPTGKRWRINGKVKTWKRDKMRVSVPIKHGLYSYGYLTADNMQHFIKE